MLHACVDLLSATGNIMIVYMVIASIYAVLATRLYAESSPEKFGGFFLSLYSMFQVCMTLQKRGVLSACKL